MSPFLCAYGFDGSRRARDGFYLCPALSHPFFEQQGPWGGDEQRAYKLLDSGFVERIIANDVRRESECHLVIDRDNIILL